MSLNVGNDYRFGSILKVSFDKLSAHCDELEQEITGCVIVMTWQWHDFVQSDTWLKSSPLIPAAA